MARPRAKTIVLAATAALVAAVTTILLLKHFASTPASQRLVLADGSVLALERVTVDSRVSFVHGTAAAKMLGRLIPSNGVHVLNVNLKRPTSEVFDSGGKSWLIAEFSLTGSNAAAHPLIKPAFFRQFRFVVYGEQGIEYVQELWRNQFLSYPDGYFGYVAASRFPRDSHWLGFRIERRSKPDAGGPWQKVADFRVQNPGRLVIQPWAAEPAPTLKAAKGMEFVLGKLTVQTIPYQARDIWNHIVTVPFEVRSGGSVLTNWSAPYGNLVVEDASGNWDMLASHRSLDPRFVWKLDADFMPTSGFAPATLAPLRLPPPGTVITTNLLNVPVTVSWDGYFLEADMVTHRPDLALQYVTVTDINGSNAYQPSGSWSRYRFRKSTFMSLTNGNYLVPLTPATVTLAVVPCVHATFYTQPNLVIGSETNR